VLVWNKCDRLAAEDLDELLRRRGGVAVSAAKPWGLEALLRKCQLTLFAEGESAKAKELAG
jgi:GTP-binding protein HflX